MIPYKHRAHLKTTHHATQHLNEPHELYSYTSITFWIYIEKSETNYTLDQNHFLVGHPKKNVLFVFRSTRARELSACLSMAARSQYWSATECAGASAPLFTIPMCKLIKGLCLNFYSTSSDIKFILRRPIFFIRLLICVSKSDTCICHLYEWNINSTHRAFTLCVHNNLN
jgi:hypothetical protein